MLRPFFYFTASPPRRTNEFRHLIPALVACGFHLVAPDLPGFGFSEFPERARFRYSFESFADVIEGFREALGLGRHALYLHDYGAHVGFRVAMRAPERITAIAVQNAEAYDEGFHHEPLKAYWRNPSAENLARLRGILTEEGTREEFVGSLPDPQVELCSPEMWKLHWPLLQRPGNIEMQLDLFADYKTNEEIRPRIHEYFRNHRPPVLVVWGRHEIFFTLEAAEAYKQDLPEAEVHILDAGHWALETRTPEVSTSPGTSLSATSRSEIWRAGVSCGLLLPGGFEMPHGGKKNCGDEMSERAEGGQPKDMGKIGKQVKDAVDKSGKSKGSSGSSKSKGSSGSKKGSGGSGSGADKAKRAAKEFLK